MDLIYALDARAGGIRDSNGVRVTGLQTGPAARRTKQTKCSHLGRLAAAAQPLSLRGTLLINWGLLALATGDTSSATPI